MSEATITPIGAYRYLRIKFINQKAALKERLFLIKTFVLTSQTP